MKILLSVLIVGFAFVQAQDPCTTAMGNNPTCAKCLAVQGSTCGWCTPTQQCLSGGKAGPTNSTCAASFWSFLSCPNCNTMTSCFSCQDNAPDCFWCSNTNSCKPRGFVGCPAITQCPCDTFKTCSDCIANNRCSFCGDTLTCLPAGNTSSCSTVYNTGCPCGVFQDCGSCTQQVNCSWCDKPKSEKLPEGINIEIPGPTSGCVSTFAGTCPLAQNCNEFCSKSTDCQSCNAQTSCAWCAANYTCVDATAPTTCMLTHTCANCGQHQFCEPCLDEGCEWCPNGTSGVCSPLPANPNPSCMSGTPGVCAVYCSGFSDCQNCNNAKGCGWCTSVNACTNVDLTDCPSYTANCGAAPIVNGGSKFDGGSFVGGMFLVIGLAALLVGGFFFYRWRTGKRSMYTELRG